MSTLVDLQHISKSFDGEMVLDDLNLTVPENSFVPLRLRQDNDAPHPRRLHDAGQRQGHV